ncbi:MAG: nickel pincer cofactor biosynthesis protein LarB [Nitrospirae bacterium]|nr:nickel pincer cofactor biosynthesis protein LarB [Nitrospirota bacterium]
MSPEGLERLLRQVRQGQVTVEQALQRLRSMPFEDLGFASLDHHRSLRQGFPEVVLCEGKTIAQVVTISRALIKKHGSFLATRAEPEVARVIRRLDRRARYYADARIVAIRPASQKQRGHVLIVTAGTADVPVAEEARVTAEIMGSRVERLYDVGVAGLHRLLGKKDRLFDARVVIVVAGMDGVLPSVVGGLVDCPVIAVPTSRGYGASFGGLAALLTMLNSCAAGVGVMNIDNGFGAGCLAHRINILGEASFVKRRS